MSFHKTRNQVVPWVRKSKQGSHWLLQATRIIFPPAFVFAISYRSYQLFTLVMETKEKRLNTQLKHIPLFCLQKNISNMNPSIQRHRKLVSCLPQTPGQIECIVLNKPRDTRA